MERAHQEAARRLEIDEQGDVAADPVDIVEAQPDAGAPGQRQQVEHGVGRAADGSVDDDGVAERRRGEQRRRAAVGDDHGDGQPPGPVGEAEAGPVDGRDRRPARQRQSERLGEAPHRRCGAHRHAVPGRAGDARLGGDERVRCQHAPTGVLGESPDVGARAERLTTRLTVEHRPGGHHHRRQVDADRAHQQPRHRLVAPAEQHRAIDRVGPQELLGLHRQLVAVEHRARAQVGLAEAHHRHLEGHPARFPHAALHRFGDIAQPAVARVEVGPGVGDGDHRAASVDDIDREPELVDRGAVDEPLTVRRGEPGGAAQRAAHGNGGFGHWCTMCCMRASERQRVSGHRRPAWPGNAMTVSVMTCRRRRSSPRPAGCRPTGRPAGAARSVPGRRGTAPRTPRPGGRRCRA